MAGQDKDITINKLEARIRELEDGYHLFSSLAEQAKLGIQIFDREGTSLFLNEYQKELLGLPDLHEGIGTFNVLTDPFSVKTGASEIYRKAYEGNTYQHEFEYNLGLEENVWNTFREKKIFFETIIPIKNQQGKIEYVAAFLQDITASRKNEKNLAESEFRWKYAVEGNKDGLWDWNLENNTVFFSTQWKQMLGYGEEEIGNHLEEWDKRVHPDDRERVYADIQAHLDGKTKFYENEHRVLKKDGTYLWVLDRGIIMAYNQAGKPTRMLGTHSDITRRKETEAALEKNRLLLQASEELSKVGAWEYTVETRTMYWTDGLYRLHDLEPGKDYDLLKESLDCYREQDREKVAEIFRECVENGTGFDLVFPVTTRKNRKRWIRIRANAVQTDGKVDRIIGSVADITEQHRNEAELRKLNATKDKFFSIIAHDLRGPLGAILGFSELAIESVARKEFDNLEMYSSYINEATQKSYNLLNNLLEWSRIQTGTLQFQPEEVNLCEIVENVNGLLNVGLQDKKLSLKKKLSPTGTIVADPYMLETILRNLLTNAIKYTPEHGTVTISHTEENDHHEIRVSDTGIGIPAEKIEKIFRIEESTSTPGTKNEKGSGLGLILCKEFAEKHGGTIGVKSVRGEGSTFTVRLPGTLPGKTAERKNQPEGLIPG